MAAPKLDMHKIRGHFAPHIYERGRAYQESGDVLNLTLRGNLLSASVQGSDVQPYHVTLELAEDDWVLAVCSCPYGENFGDYCKHIAAVVLEFHHRPDHVVSETSITDLLAPLDADTLRGRWVSCYAALPRRSTGSSCTCKKSVCKLKRKRLKRLPLKTTRPLLKPPSTPACLKR